VAGSHVRVAGLDGGVAGQLAVLLVHVVGARAGIVTDPDTEVLDLKGLLLVDLRSRIFSCEERLDELIRVSFQKVLGKQTPSN
jgi:hypothetical protein